uniref:MRG domain-containing protein n=1 Tax=Meloidogyne javanica TaxID=6303 RepID=A0A915LWY9_MELJA
MPPCLINNKLEENIQIEVELSQFILYLRAKNAEKYVLPEALLDSSELRVFFVRILYGNNKNVSKEKEENVCQLKSELEYKETKEELNINYPTKGPYKRTRSKLPRRSTKAAQSYLSADHYVQKSKNSKQSRRMFPPPLQTPSWPLEGNNNNNQITSTTTPAYIDIIRDRQLYEEVQRSK